MPDVTPTPSAPPHLPDGVVAVLPMRNRVLFPHVLAPVVVGRPKSLAALRHALAARQPLVLALQLDPQDDEPGLSGLCPVATLATVVQHRPADDGQAHAACQGLRRVRLVEAVEGHGFLADLAARLLAAEPAQKQALLELLSTEERMARVLQFVSHRLEVLRQSQEIGARTKERLDDRRRGVPLEEQLRAIRRELGENGEGARASAGCRAWARPRSGRVWRAPSAGPSCACRSAACTTRPSCAATAAPTWARCRGCTLEEKLQIAHRCLVARQLQAVATDYPREAGAATGPARTPAGGDILFIEATRVVGSGRLTLTGQLGDVMQECAQAALTLVKSLAPDLGVPAGAFEGVDVHVPAGAIPKDGPSAGVAMFVALASLFSDRPVNHGLAMTGEISLRGLVLPVGGIKEKVLAAQRAGLGAVMLPARNRKDLHDVPESVRPGLRFTWLETVTEALATALCERPSRPAGALRLH